MAAEQEFRTVSRTFAMPRIVTRTLLAENFYAVSMSRYESLSLNFGINHDPETETPGDLMSCCRLYSLPQKLSGK
jgi:hypothetical protein